MRNTRNDRQSSAPRARRAVAETGSFGKSARRSRSRTGSAAPKREDANMKVADELFSKFLAPGPRIDDDDPVSASAAATSSATATGSAASIKRKTSYLSQTVSTQDAVDPAAAAAQQQQQQQPLRFQKEPTEVILRGYASPDQQYAAINHYEQVAGRICEDYPREPPIEARRYKSELRDPAFNRQQPLTPAERSKVTRVAGGEHWIKITFESAAAADAAVYASPQKILGHLVYAEPYRGLPPKEDAAVVDVIGDAAMFDPNNRTNTLFGKRRPSQGKNGRFAPKTTGNTLPRTWAVGNPRKQNQPEPDVSPLGSQTTTQTMDTGTASTTTATDARPVAMPPPDLFAGIGNYPAEDTAHDSTTQANDGNPAAAPPQEDSAYCRRIPTARRVKLLPAEQAVAPQPSPIQVLLARIPLIGWFSGSMIGSEVPRNELGEFDLARASLFWRLMYYLDYWFSLFGSDLVSSDKED